MESIERNAPRAGWKNKLFGNLAEFKNGLNYSKDNIGKGLKIIGVSDFQHHSSIEYNALAEVSGFDGIDESYLLREDDLLFVRSNGNKNLIGRVLHIKNIGQERITFSGFTIRARINSEEILPAYAALLFGTPEVKARLFAEGGGTNIANLNQDMLSMMGMPLPSIDMQAEIIAASQMWEDAIALEVKQLKGLRRRNDSLSNDLLLEKKRLVGFTRPWQEFKIGSLVKEVKRPLVWNDDEEYSLISIRRRSGGAFLREKLFGHQILTKNLRTAKAGDFLISKMQIVHGASGLVPADLDGMKISGSYVALVARNPANFDMAFFDCLSKLPWFYHLCYVCSYGVHIEKMTFDLAEFLSQAIRVPEVDEQHAIAEIITTAEAEIKLHERKLEALREQKGGLLQKLLNGEILLS